MNKGNNIQRLLFALFLLLFKNNSKQQSVLFPRVMSQAAVLVRIFVECREGQIKNLLKIIR